MARITRLALVGLAGTLLLAPGLRAQQRPAPTVAVVGFLSDSSSRLSQKAIDAMAEELALQLVESGRYRVLDRAWLGIESGTPSRTPVARTRDAARDAGVDYLVVGRISKFSEIRRSAPQGARILPPPGRPYFGYAPMAPRTSTKHLDSLRVSLELIDVTTGSVLSESSSTCAMPPKSGLARVTPLLLLPSAPIAAAAAMAARSHAPSSGLDPGLERAMTTAGQALIRWNPPTSVNK